MRGCLVTDLIILISEAIFTYFSFSFLFFSFQCFLKNVFCVIKEKIMGAFNFKSAVFTISLGVFPILPGPNFHGSFVFSYSRPLF